MRAKYGVRWSAVRGGGRGVPGVSSLLAVTAGAGVQICRYRWCVVRGASEVLVRRCMLHCCGWKLMLSARRRSVCSRGGRGRVTLDGRGANEFVAVRSTPGSSGSLCVRSDVPREFWPAPRMEMICRRGVADSGLVCRLLCHPATGYVRLHRPTGSGKAPARASLKALGEQQISTV